jgi:hypothetical protein
MGLGYIICLFFNVFSKSISLNQYAYIQGYIHFEKKYPLQNFAYISKIFILGVGNPFKLG